LVLQHVLASLQHASSEDNFVFFWWGVQNAPPTAHSCKQAPEPSCHAIVSTPCPNGIWQVHSKAPGESKVH